MTPFPIVLLTSSFAEIIIPSIRTNLDLEYENFDGQKIRFHPNLHVC